MLASFYASLRISVAHRKLGSFVNSILGQARLALRPDLAARLDHGRSDVLLVAVAIQLLAERALVVGVIFAVV